MKGKDKLCNACKEPLGTRLLKQYPIVQFSQFGQRNRFLFHVILPRQQDAFLVKVDNLRKVGILGKCTEQRTAKCALS